MAEAQTAPSAGTSHVHKTGASFLPLSLTQQNPHLCSVLVALNLSAVLFFANVALLPRGQTCPTGRDCLSWLHGSDRFHFYHVLCGMESHHPPPSQVPWHVMAALSSLVE